MPEEARYPIWRYLNVHQAHSPALAADGQHAAFVSDISGLPQLWKVRLPRQGEPVLWPEPLTFGGDRVMGAWSSPAAGDGRLIYARDVGGNENAQLFLLAPDGQETALTAGHEEAMHQFGQWSADGRQILLAANRRDRGLFDVYVQSLGQEARLVWQNEEAGFLAGLTFSPDGRRAVVSRMASTFDHDLFEIDLLDGTARQVNPPEEARYESAWYAADGRSLLVNTDLGSDFLYVGRLDLRTGAVEPLVQERWDLEYLTRSPDCRYLAYVVNDNGASELRLLDLLAGRTRQAPDVGWGPGVVASSDDYLAFSPDSARLAYSFTAATHTSDVLVWDLVANRVQAVTRSAHGGLPAESFVPCELITYPTFDGRQIPAWFYRPRGAEGRPAPVIVYVHGGPEAQFRPYFHFFLQYFLQHGFAVLAPNVRGSTGYGKAYIRLDDVEKRLDSVADLAHAAHWLRQQPGIDGSRLVVYGGSYGGYMVLAALTMYPDLWAAGVDIVGISNLVTFLENTSAYRRAYREAEYGSLARDRAVLERLSPIHQVDRISAPLMVIHGANDPRVPLGEAQQMVAALQARSVPVELLVFQDEGHGVVKLKNRLVAYPAIIAFLERHGVVA